ncbi:similar to TRICHOME BIREFRINGENCE-LIKE 19 [Actinidia rufa]|uniref:Similar to TRICHOME BIREFRINGENCE-LIKE 19 n=1 Tax=Actinidia rufa TaxID=165716 RepID=A0A7J0EK27_9ERIC|nr:similar to TRICHOME BIREFRINGENCE-LIKE 19 [Actinidia rufa]
MVLQSLTTRKPTHPCTCGLMQCPPMLLQLHRGLQRSLPMVQPLNIQKAVQPEQTGLQRLSLMVQPFCIKETTHFRRCILAILLAMIQQAWDWIVDVTYSRGSGVPNPKGPYYTNETKCEIDDRQNCMKFGTRPDTDFMKWRWKPYKCELPLFDALEFLELVRGKKLAFLGDSVGRNQMQSLVCLLASAVIPQDISYTPDKRFRSWLYADYNFTIIALWSPLLVKASEPDEPQGYLMNLYLDEPDEAWTSQIEDIDILIISAGQWFFRPFVYYQKGEMVGCHICNKNNIKELDVFYTYKMAFRTAFQTLLKARKFRGLTFLRTFSASQFENGEWNTGGDCRRKKPFTRHEMRLDWCNLEFYKTQVKELKVAERRGKKRGLKFKVLDTTEAMLMRPDGHPSHYGHWPQDNNTAADCVHWCMPGPIDTWNELLLQMLKKENEETSSEREKC